MYAWPILKTMFTEILSKDDWLKLIDHLFTYREDPEIVLYFCVSILIQSRSQILNVNTIEELFSF